MAGRIMIEPQDRVTIKHVETTTIRPSIHISIHKKEYDIIQPKQIQTIKPPTERITTLAEELAELGWIRNPQGYAGNLKGRKKFYPGFLHNINGNKYQLYIKKPSRKILTGRKRLCLLKTAKGWYYINFSKGNNNPMGQIAETQEYIKEVGE